MLIVIQVTGSERKNQAEKTKRGYGKQTHFGTVIVDSFLGPRGRGGFYFARVYYMQIRESYSTIFLF